MHEYRARIGVLYAIFVAISALAYLRAFDNPFRDDDFVYLHRAETTSIRSAFTPSPNFAFYRPGAIALFSVEHRFFGRNGGAYIAFNYTLHVLIAALLLLILLRLGTGSPVAILASGLFLCGVGHYGKEVLWACTGGALAALLLSLCAIFIALRWRNTSLRDPSRTAFPGTTPTRLAVFLLLFLSPLFHEASAVTAVLVAGIASGCDGSRTRTARTALFWFLTPIVVWAITWGLISNPYPAYRGVAAGIAGIIVRLIGYAGFMVVPIQRSSAVGAQPVPEWLISFGEPFRFGVGIFVAAGAAILAVRGRGSIRILCAWLILSIAPFALIDTPRSWLELRYLYFASVPYCALVAIGLCRLHNCGRRSLRITAAAAVVALTAGSIALQLALEHRYHRHSQPNKTSAAGRVRTLCAANDAGPLFVAANAFPFATQNTEDKSP